MSVPAVPPVILSFAASDPTGGSGAQADLLTIAALGGHPALVLTGMTIQDTRGITACQPQKTTWVDAQARAILEDMPVAAIKIGFVGNPDIALTIAEIVADYPDIPVVLAPSLKTSGQNSFADDELVSAICNILLPLTTLATPNSLEARRMVEEDEEITPSLPECARQLIDLGLEYVLITGTHEPTPQVINTLYGPGGIVVQTDAWERLRHSYLGAGDTLAAAIATLLGFRLPLVQAVRKAQNFTWHSLRHSFATGMGRRIPDRFFANRK
ncbi:MAG: hydroxymethylpyrimidine/phosphomethylpyrimidine kinase [Betaproteobacteria bacterium]|nr:hydroxymethylpyrimidine/phosphomethylpyrimidine kinase [Betaproteobacteria bacterium]